MAEKNSFVMHNSWGDAIDMMNYEQKGKILEALLNYSRGKEVCIDDPSLTFIFAIFKQQMDADNEKYRKTCEARAANGSKGGEANQANGSKSKQKVANGSKSKQKVANQADIDIEVDVDSDVDVEDDFDALKTKEQKEKSANADQKKAAASAYADDPELDTAIKDFIEHRKKLKKPMTDKAVRLFIARVDSMAADTASKIALIDNAIEKGWQTVYPDKEQGIPRASPGQSTDDYLMSIINGEVEI